MKDCQWNCDEGYCLSWEAKHNEQNCNYCTMKNEIGPAPTVATDKNEEEEEEEEQTFKCIHCNGTGRHKKPGLAQIASPVEEEQELLWKEVEMLIDTYTKPVLELKTRFLLTRKS